MSVSGLYVYVYTMDHTKLVKLNQLNVWLKSGNHTGYLNIETDYKYRNHNGNLTGWHWLVCKTLICLASIDPAVKVLSIAHRLICVTGSLSHQSINDAKVIVKQKERKGVEQTSPFLRTNSKL